jgi:hypothetical protein
MFGFGNFLKANRTLGELRLVKAELAKEKKEHAESLSILNGVRASERTVKSELYNYKKAIPNSDDLPYLAKIMDVIVKNIRFTDVPKVAAPLWQKYNKKS